MAVANFNLQKFRSTVFRDSLARTNRFEVLITPPNKLSGSAASISQLASLYVEQISFPLLNIATKGLKIFGPTYQRPFTSEYGGEGISVTFHVDRDMRIKKFFDDWMHIIIDPEDFTVGYPSDYTTRVNIKQLDEAENVTYEIDLLEAFPRNLNLMELNNASSNQTHRLNVLFAYRYWREKGASNPNATPQPITNPQIPRINSNLPVPNGITVTTPYNDYAEDDPYGDI